jgi:hypothetical protein
MKGWPVANAASARNFAGEQFEARSSIAVGGNDSDGSDSDGSDSGGSDSQSFGPRGVARKLR